MMRSGWAYAIGLAMSAMVAAPVMAMGSPVRETVAERLAPGAGHYRFNGWDGPALPVYYAIPQQVTAQTPVLIVMHGTNRDADRYRDEWRQHAEARGAILVVPEFSKQDFPGSAGYNFGNFVDRQGQPVPRNLWSFSAIEPLFDDIRRRTGTEVASYTIYGHSAGSQFVHRFAMFVDTARFSRAIAANAGWYTMPDLNVDFPYGLQGTPLDEAALKAALARPITLLLGTDDTDPQHSSLRRTPEAMQQGPHRFARGHSFYHAGKAAAARLGVNFGWELREVPGVAHRNSGMAAAAITLIGQ